MRILRGYKISKEPYSLAPLFGLKFDSTKSNHKNTKKKPFNYSCKKHWAKALVDCEFSEEIFFFNKKLQEYRREENKLDNIDLINKLYSWRNRIKKKNQLY